MISCSDQGLWGLNSGLCVCKAGTLQTEPSLQALFVFSNLHFSCKAGLLIFMPQIFTDWQFFSYVLSVHTSLLLCSDPGLWLFITAFYILKLVDYCDSSMLQTFSWGHSPFNFCVTAFFTYKYF